MVRHANGPGSAYLEMSDELPVRDQTRVRCARCARIVHPHEEAWVELATGRLRMAVLDEVDDSEPFRRAWHVDCFG